MLLNLVAVEKVLHNKVKRSPNNPPNNVIPSLYNPSAMNETLTQISIVISTVIDT